MQIEEHRYTTIWDASDGLVPDSPDQPVRTDALRLILGSRTTPAQLSILGEASSAAKRLRVVLTPECLELMAPVSRLANLHGVQVYGLTTTGLEALDSLPDSLAELEIGIECSVKKPHAWLTRFRKLQRLSISGRVPPVDLTKHPELTSLAYYYVKDVDLSSILFGSSVTSLTVHHGSALPVEIGESASSVRSLDFWRVRGVDSLGWLSKCPSLEQLELGGLSKVTTLPALAPCAQLHHVRLEQMKGLQSIASVAASPSIESLHLVGMNSIPEADYWALAQHPSLRALTPGYSSTKRSTYVSSQLQLPPVEYGVRSELVEF